VAIRRYQYSVSLASDPDLTLSLFEEMNAKQNVRHKRICYNNYYAYAK